MERKTVLYPGDCAFMRRDNRMWLQKRVGKGEPYRSIVLKFSKAFLREFYQTLDRQQIPIDSKREKASLLLLPKIDRISALCSSRLFRISMLGRNPRKRF